MATAIKVRLTGKAAEVAGVFAQWREEFERQREAFREAQYFDHVGVNGPAGAELPDVLETPTALWRTLGWTLAALVCVAGGHDYESEEFVAADYDDAGRIVDIDGGGVDYWCTRCGHGGRSWF